MRIFANALCNIVNIVILLAYAKIEPEITFIHITSITLHEESDKSTLCHVTDAMRWKSEGSLVSRSND